MKKEETILQEAERLIFGERRDDWGDVKPGFIRIAKLWSAHLDKEVTVDDVCMMMVLLKTARQKNKHSRDSLVDIAGYAALAEQCNK